MQNSATLPSLVDFLGQSPSPYHAVSLLTEILQGNGFHPFPENGSGKSIQPGNYFFQSGDATLAALTLTDQPPEETGLRLAGAHTDSPSLKVKPQPVRSKHQMLQLGVEVYGGALLSPWFDRDLSLAGRISWLDTKGRPCRSLLDFQRPIAIIPSLAIHLDRDANTKKSINKQTDLTPLLSLDEKAASFEELVFAGLRKQEPDANPDELLAHDLFFYDVQKPALTGLKEEFITGARLDNLLSCHVLTRALIEAGGKQNSLIILNDHEEVGSVSADGAQGPFLKMLLERLAPDPAARSRMLARSLLVSVDNAHALHPNFADKHDAEHLPLLNKGPVIKWNANQRYASDAVSGGFFRGLARRAGVGVQDFVMRNDMACGSTIGPLTAAETGIRTVDAGVPTLAMHSIRETAGSRDYHDLHKIMQLFFSLADNDPLWTGLR